VPGDYFQSDRRKSPRLTAPRASIFRWRDATIAARLAASLLNPNMSGTLTRLGASAPFGWRQLGLSQSTSRPPRLRRAIAETSQKRYAAWSSQPEDGVGKKESSRKGVDNEKAIRDSCGHRRELTLRHGWRTRIGRDPAEVPWIRHRRNERRGDSLHKVHVDDAI
jgi:hypothetical protein